MEQALSILIVMEMLAVNLFTVDICSRRRYSGLRTFLTIVAFTFVLTAVTNSWWGPLGFEEGNALFAVIGVVYLLPLSYLYDGPLPGLSGILFSAWIYTLLVFCLAVRCAYLLGGGSFTASVALVQTVLYAVTLAPFLLWAKRGFLYVLKNTTRKNLYLLQAVSLCWFGSVILINAQLVHTDSGALKLATILAVSVDAVLSYWLIVSMFKSLREVKDLQDIVYTDPLTGIFNREKLFVDAEALLKQRKRFRLIFMDLDHFKSVNDQHGHLAGDHYLTAFARATGGFLRTGETLYRISGDEFVIISRRPDADALPDRLKMYPDHLDGLPFLGCSIGWADHPDECATMDALIALADQRMYRNKHPERL